MEARIQGARDAYAEAEEELRSISAELDDPDGDLDDIEARLIEARETYESAGADVDRLVKIQEARALVPAVTEPPAPKAEPQARGSMKEEQTYRPNGGPGYFWDIVQAAKGDVGARERLERNDRQVAVEARDLTTTATAGGGFVPPLYMGDLFAEGLRAGRPFANALGSRPLPGNGMSITLPRITTNPTAAVQVNEGDDVDETDLVEATLTTPVNTIAGVQDVSVQLLERSDPGIDMVLFAELRDAYDTTLDNQLLNGSGVSGQHDGITNVTGSNDITYTDGDPAGAELIGHMYDALQRIHSNRFRPGDMWILHPRRSAWLAAELSSTFPLFQQSGSAVQNIGAQNNAQLVTSQGVTIVNDANVVTTDGTGTDQDEVYAVRSSDLILFEDPLRATVHTDVLSLSLEVRLRVYAFSAFISGRYPTGISTIAGTGLVAPTFGADTTP